MLPGFCTGMLLGAQASGGGLSDPHFNKVVLLCGFDGADGSTTFDDKSGANHALTAVGNAQLDTAQAKFGSALLLDGNGDRVTLPNSADWDFGNEAFTVEAWVRFAVTETGPNYLVSQWDSGLSQRAWGIKYENNTWLFYSTTDGTNATAVNLSFAWTQSGGAWFHFALTRDVSGNVRAFIDGEQIGTTQPRNVTIFNSDQPLWIGAIASSTPANDFNGHIEELRITKGVARYTSNFAAPDAAFPRS